MKKLSYKCILTIFTLAIFVSLNAEENSETYETPEYNSLLYYEVFPLDIRSATSEDWQNFYFLTENQIKKLSSSTLNKKSDLYKIGLDSATVEELLPYITTDLGSIYLLTRTVDQENKHEYSSYIATSEKLFVSFKNSRLGLLAQKDAGETNSLDYKNWFFQQKRLSHIFNIILGSYKMRLGQGIVFGDRYANTISALSTQSPIVSTGRIAPYTSFTEQWYLHGATFTGEIGNFRFSPYYSKSELDINLKNDSISSFDESGYHATASPTTDLKITGIYSQWTNDYLEIGYNIADFSFGKPFLDKDKSQEYQAHSVDFRYKLENSVYFSEYAKIDEKSAKVFGMKTTHENLTQTLIYRDYEKELPTYLGRPVSQTTNFANQRGIYYGCLWEPIAHFKINFYLDLWKTPKTSNEAEMPLSGQELLIWARYQSKKRYFSLKYSIQEKEQLLSTDKIGDQRISDYKIDFHREINRFWKFKSRYNYRIFQEDEIQSGYLTYAEIIFRLKKLSLHNRICYYNSNTLVYMYQQGVDGTMLTSSYKGDDVYYYFLISSKILSFTKFQVKYSDYLTKTDSKELTIQLLLSKNF